MYANALILMGPTGVGKSTQTRLLGSRLRWPMVSLDAVADQYYQGLQEVEEATEQLVERYGLNHIQNEGALWAREMVGMTMLSRIRKGKSRYASEQEFKEELELTALKAFLSDHHEGVLELGAGHAIFESEEALNKAKEILKPFPHVVALLPDPDENTSVEILKRNLKAQGRMEPEDTIRYYVTRKSYRDLATHHIYTAGKSPMQTARELMTLVAA